MVKHIEYYKGENGGFPQVRAVVSLVSPCLLVACSCTKSAPALTNLLFGLWRFVWISELLVIHLSPIMELQHALLPPKCYEPRNSPQLFLLSLFSPLDSQLNPSRSLRVQFTHLDVSIGSVLRREIVPSIFVLMLCIWFFGCDCLLNFHV
jgi:hypothetical protein